MRTVEMSLTAQNLLMLLSLASRALDNFVHGSWGSAALHPRLYAFARYRGLGRKTPGRRVFSRNLFRLLVQGHTKGPGYLTGLSETRHPMTAGTNHACHCLSRERIPGCNPLRHESLLASKRGYRGRRLTPSQSCCRVFSEAN